MKPMMLCFALAVCLLLYACTQAPKEEATVPVQSASEESTAPPTEPVPAGTQNSAYPTFKSYSYRPESVALIMGGTLRNAPEATLHWENGDSAPIYIIPRFVGSTVAIYKQVKAGRNNRFTHEWEECFSTTVDDGCVISVSLDYSTERWLLEVIDHNGTVSGKSLDAIEESSMPVFNWVDLPQFYTGYFGPAEPENSAFSSFTPPHIFTHGAIVQHSAEQPTLLWQEDNAPGFYIIPRYLGSTFSLYRILGEEDGAYIWDEEPTYSTLVEDGCIIYAELERPKDAPKWCVQIVTSGGIVWNYPLLYTQDETIEWLDSISSNTLGTVEIVDGIGEFVGAKPVIYLYPEEETAVTVKLEWQGTEIAPQELTAPERTGFTVIEWGGCQIEQKENVS